MCFDTVLVAFDCQLHASCNSGKSSCAAGPKTILVPVRRYGFFNNKRIVLFDTLVKECSEDEVVAVLAHGEGGRQTAEMAVVQRACVTVQHVWYA